MMEPVQVKKVKNFEELIASDYNIWINLNLFDRDVWPMLDYYNLPHDRFHDANKDFSNPGLYETAFFFQCEGLTLFMKFGDIFSDLAESEYYRLNLNINPGFLEFEAGIMNPFIERIQLIMNRCFEAGLPTIWYTMYYVEMSRMLQSSEIFKDIYHQSNEVSDFLEISQILPIFGILSIGYFLASFVFLFEIFYHDFLKHLSFKMIKKKIWKASYKKKGRS